jgi:chemotaxis protein MotB
MRVLTILVAVLAMSGCVKKATHQQALARIADLEGQVAERDRTIGSLQGDLGTAKTDADTAHDQVEASEAELAELREKRDADQRRLAAYEALQARFKSLVDAGDLEVAFRNGQMTLKLPSGVLFPSGDAALSEKGQKTLARVTKLLLEMKDRHFLVAGHTDNVPIKTDLFANNWYLSTSRAVTVVEYMVAQGFPATQLAAAGYADTDPIASNKSKKGRKKNRRIEIIVVPDLSELPKLTREP